MKTTNAKSKRRDNRKKKNAFARRVYPTPASHADARQALFRMMCDIQNSWKECPLPLCRRARACHGKTFECYKPGPPLSEQERARARYEFGKQLDIAIARRDRRRAERGEGEPEVTPRQAMAKRRPMRQDARAGETERSRAQKGTA